MGMVVEKVVMVVVVRRKSGEDGRQASSPTGENSHGSVVVTGNAGRGLVTGAERE